MPLMMDDEMDMDDLFGDGGGLSLPSRPPPTKELHQRIDELRRGGCCQGIAWSRWGCIASIAPNGVALELRNLRCDPADGTWALSSPTVTANFSSPLDGRLKHLSWSPTGSDLAVIDTTGRVTVISIFASLNKASLSRDCRADPADDLHGVIGCYWLNLAAYPANRPNILHGPAIKEGSGYRFESSQTPVLGPCHPNQSRSAFVCITTNGTLRFLWQQNNSKWNESHTELESIASSDDLITHAAICSDKNGTLLIAYTTASMQLRTVRALIEWNQPKIDKVPPANLPLNPTIKTRHLAGTSWAPTISSDPMNTSHFDSSMVQISHLELLPPFADANSKSVPPTIITIRSSLPTFASHYTQDVHTTVDRWEIRDKIQSVHHAFEQLSSRRNGAGHPPQPVVYLKKLESFAVKKVVVSMESINHGKVIAFACSDNSIEYRDRTDMSETFNDGNLERVWHLSQIGFAYTDDEPCLQVSLSPTYCSAVQIRNDGKVKWKQLNYHLRQIGTSTDDPLYSAAIAAITLSCATAVMRNANWDDILATIQPHATAQFAYDWLADFTPLIKLNADFSEETHHDVLVRNTTIQLCLCIQYSIGFKGEFNPRTFSGKLAWLVLQLRNIVVVVTMAANLHLPGPGGQNANERTTPLEDPEVINSLVGSVRWALDLVAWIIDTLLTLPTTLPPHITLTNASSLSLPDLLSYLHKTNTISLHLLLSSPSRGFLTAVCRRLQHLDFIACKAVLHTNASLEPNPANPNPSPPTKVSSALKAAYVQIAQLTSSSILNIKTLETLLASITSLIKNSYASSTNPVLSGSAPAERTRNNIEMKMLFGSSFPDVFKPVIVELFRKEGLLDGVKEQIDSSQLFFADFSMLEVDENKASVERRRRSEKTMDCFRKVWLENPPKGLAAEENGRQGRWRRCARCAAVMEDVLTQRQALQWLIMQQRRCFCGGFWNTIAPGKTIA